MIRSSYLIFSDFFQDKDKIIINNKHLCPMSVNHTRNIGQKQVWVMQEGDRLKGQVSSRVHINFAVNSPKLLIFINVVNRLLIHRFPAHH